MVLSLPGDNENDTGRSLRVKQELPESGSEIYNGEDVAARSSDVADAFADIHHGVFVGVGVCIQGPKILH